MADTKISDLDEATVLADTDELVIASSGDNKKVTGATLRSEVGGGGDGEFVPWGVLPTDPPRFQANSTDYFKPGSTTQHIVVLEESSFTSGNVAWATVRDGQTYPNMVWFRDEGDGIYFTATNRDTDAITANIYVFGDSFTDGDAATQTLDVIAIGMWGDTWFAEVDIGLGDDNLQGCIIGMSGALRLGTTRVEGDSDLGVKVSSQAGDPNTINPGPNSYGGAVNDVYYQEDAADVTELMWVCTTAGVPGTAVWSKYFDLLVAALP